MSDGVEDLGSTGGGEQNPELREPFYESVAQFEGVWIGQAEEPLGASSTDARVPAYLFPSGSSQIVLELRYDEGSSNGDVVGTIAFGEGEPPPPPVNPDIGYPVGLSYQELLSYSEPAAFQFSGVLDDYKPLPPLEGFVYSIRYGYLLTETPPANEVGVPDGVLRINYNTSEYLAPWCELQTPLSDAEGGYTCMPRIQGNPYGQVPGECMITRLEADGTVHEEEPIDCDKAFLCGRPSGRPEHSRCACDAEGCVAEPDLDWAMISLRRSGDGLVGIINEGWFLNARGLRVQLGTLRFRRAD